MEQVWPAYRACWQETKRDDFSPARARIRVRMRWFPDGRTPGPTFEAPRSVWSVPHLRQTRIPACKNLWKALRIWSANAGRGVRDDWLLESALVSLTHYGPGDETPTDPVFQLGEDKSSEQFFWRYTHQFHSSERIPSFTPHFTGGALDRKGRPWHPDAPAIWIPDREGLYGSWKQFEQRMINQLKRQLSDYRKDLIAHHGLNKAGYRNYARWTIARLSGRTWPEIDERFGLSRGSVNSISRHSAGVYSDGISQAKKRVREFASEIGLTL